MSLPLAGGGGKLASTSALPMVVRTLSAAAAVIGATATGAHSAPAVTSGMRERRRAGRLGIRRIRSPHLMLLHGQRQTDTPCCNSGQKFRDNSCCSRPDVVH